MCSKMFHEFHLFSIFFPELYMTITASRYEKISAEKKRCWLGAKNTKIKNINKNII